MFVKKSKGFSRDDSSGQIISSTRTCIQALRPFATIAPFGSCIQALLDVGLAVLDRIEQIRAWESGKIELCRKINYVFGMVTTALNHPYATNAPDLLEDLDRIVKVLQEIDEFVQKTKSKGCKLRRFIQCSSDFERVVEFGSKLDEAVKMLTTKSIIQLRLDIQTLKETIEVSAENLKDTFRSSTSTFQSSTERLTEAVRSTAEKLKETYQLSTEKIEKTLGTVRSPLDTN
ncbi:hypothetical protein ACEPAG_4302 [Sanghuangporus baumii]